MPARSACSILVDGGLRFAVHDWTAAPTPDELAQHCLREGIFSPRPFQLRHDPDPSTLACTTALAACWCRRVRWSERLLAPLFECDPRVYNVESAERIAEAETYRTPRVWSARQLDRLRIHLRSHGAMEFVHALEKTLKALPNPRRTHT
jgi:hypothetical protein